MSASTIDDANARLASARQAGSDDELVDALATHANLLVSTGQLASALSEVDEIALIQQRRAEADGEARYLVLAATLARLLGQFDAAYTRAERATRLAAPGTPTSVSAWTTLGDVALAAGKPSPAIAAYAQALAQMDVAGGGDLRHAALLRQRALALVSAGRPVEAAADLVAAHDALVRAGKTRAAVQVLVEAASAMVQSGDTTRANKLAGRARAAAEAAGDLPAQADLQLLAAAVALEQHQGGSAMQALLAARAQALEADAPITYLAAAVGMSDLADAQGDRLAAYAALATGWVTLGDRIGREAARVLLEPRLRQLQQRWGAESFAEVKSAYEAERRAPPPHEPEATPR